MTAIIPESQRTPIPRYVKPREGGPQNSASGVIQLSSAISGRFNTLPDYDPNESDDDIRAKLVERFEILREMAAAACEPDTTIKAMIISGPGGVGKTFEVEKQLKEWDPEGLRYRASKGYVRATALYKLLYEHRFPGNVTTFDDADTIFFDETSLNILKVACDTTQTREITWGSETIFADEGGDPIPNRFEYEGTVIFVTNIDFDLQIAKGNKLAPHLEALMTRSLYIDMGMKTKRDYLIRIYQVRDEGLFEQIGLTIEQENEVMQFIEDNIGSIRELSLRMALKIGSLRKADSPIGWQRIAKLTCCRGIR